MKKIFISLLYLTFIFILSCSNSEKVIDNTKDTWNVLASVNGQNPALMLIQFPNDSIISNDVYSQNNNGQFLPGPVTKIAEFRGQLFLLIPSQFKIIVINNNTYKVEGTIDFTSDMLAPSEICFANATTAYVSQGNDTVVSVVDLTNYIVARKIKVGKNPVSIACSGNQIFVANQGDNTVSLIDSRYNTEAAVIPVQTAPTYVTISADGTKAVVLSLGAGKLDSNQTKTAAQATLIDVTSHSIIHTTDLSAGPTNAIDFVPHGIIVSQNDWAYIPSQSSLLGYFAGTGDRVTYLQNTAYETISYNFVRSNEILVLQNNNGVYSAITLDLDTYNPKASHIFTQSVNYIYTF